MGEDYTEVTFRIRSEYADELQRSSEKVIALAEAQARFAIQNRHQRKLERQEIQDAIRRFWAAAPSVYHLYRKVRPTVEETSQAYELVSRRINMPVAVIPILVSRHRNKFNRYLILRRRLKILNLRLKRRTGEAIAADVGRNRQSVHRYLAAIKKDFARGGTPLQYRILAMALRKKRQKEIVQALGCNRQTVHRALKRARQVARCGNV